MNANIQQDSNFLKELIMGITEYRSERFAEMKQHFDNYLHLRDGKSLLSINHTVSRSIGLSEARRLRSKNIV